jgi:hypothetical protein
MEPKEKDIIIQGYEVRVNDKTLCTTKELQIARICANAIAEHIEGGDEVELVTVASLVQNNQK